MLLWVLSQPTDGLTVGELAERIGVEPPMVTKSLVRLDDSGWFTREPVPGDRRRVRLVLTDRGREAVPAIAEVWQQLAETATQGMPAQARADLVGLLEGVQAALLTTVDQAVLAEE